MNKLLDPICSPGACADEQSVFSDFSGSDRWGSSTLDKHSECSQELKSLELDIPFHISAPKSCEEARHHLDKCLTGSVGSSYHHKIKFIQSIESIIAVDETNKSDELRPKLNSLRSQEALLDSKINTITSEIERDRAKCAEFQDLTQTFNSNHSWLLTRQSYCLDLYCKCPGNFGALENAIFNSYIKWGLLRLNFKRSFLRILSEQNSGLRNRKKANDETSSFEDHRGTMSPSTHQTLVAKSKGIYRSRANFPKHAKKALKKWFAEHEETPYPSNSEKDALIEETGLEPAQISTWFINERMRNWRCKRKLSASLIDSQEHLKPMSNSVDEDFAKSNKKPK